jgi:methionyl-tRNA formyltransferase
METCFQSFLRPDQDERIHTFDTSNHSTLPMRLIFLATGSVAVPSIRAIAAAGRDDLLAVVTQPPRPAGRKRVLTQCPAALAAQELGLRLLQPEDVNDPKDPFALTAIRELAPDLLIVADYGQFLKSALLAIPRLAAINIHPSLLPRYRGATPLQRTLLNHDALTGVSILYVTRQMDAGDILDQVTTAVAPDETCPQLSARLAKLGAERLLSVLDRFRAADAPLPGIPQDESQVILAPLLSKTDGLVRWDRPAQAIYDQWRAFLPWPGCTAKLPDDTPFKLLEIAPPSPETTFTSPSAPPGTVLAADGPALLVATATTPLRLLLVQPAGRPPMYPSALLAGRRLSLSSLLP